MIKYYRDLSQGSQEWLDAKIGIMSASQVKSVLTTKLKIAENNDSRSIVFELLAQRISGYIEPIFQNDDMERGHIDEIYARSLYSKKYAKVEEVGFITNNDYGFILGYSPDGIVGDDGLIEIKSRIQKHQIKTIIENVVPDEYMMQIQTGLLATNRKWCDFISYSAGLPMYVKRVLPNKEIQDAIIEAGKALEERIKELELIYNTNSANFHLTQRINEEVIVL